MKYFPFSRSHEIDRVLKLYNMYLRGLGQANLECNHREVIKELLFHGLFSDLMPQDLNRQAERIVNSMRQGAALLDDEEIFWLNSLSSSLSVNTPFSLNLGCGRTNQNIKWITSVICGVHNLEPQLEQVEMPTKEFLLYCLVNIMGASDIDQHTSDHVSFLLTRFDITGRLYESYGRITKQPLGRYDVVGNYILLGIVLVTTFLRYADFKALNAAIKVYDLLSALMDASRADCYWSLLAAGFILEERVVLNLYEREGFRLPAD